jgi:hypothetical protein
MPIPHVWLLCGYSHSTARHIGIYHIVGLYTYCKMMHGAYNVKLKYKVLKHTLIFDKRLIGRHKKLKCITYL